MMNKTNRKKPKTFTQALHELERIVADIERGDLDFEDNLKHYARARFLLGYCRTALSDAEDRIRQMAEEP